MPNRRLSKVKLVESLVISEKYKVTATVTIQINRLIGRVQRSEYQKCSITVTSIQNSRRSLSLAETDIGEKTEKYPVP